jgi:hypothetical protein
MIKSNAKPNIQPTFLLKNVNPTALFKKYKSGYFNRPVKNKTLIDIVKPQLKVSTLNKNTEINTKIVTSGEKSVELFLKNGRKMPMGGRCQGCTRDFTHEQIGYPLAYECQYLIDENDKYKPVHIFWVEGCFHSYGCCLIYIRRINNGILKDNLMVDAEIMLKLMYHLIYNIDHPLKEDNDPLLLDTNGGSLTVEEFEDNSVSYNRSNTVIKIPAQVVYNRV